MFLLNIFTCKTPHMGNPTYLVISEICTSLFTSCFLFIKCLLFCDFCFILGPHSHYFSQCIILLFPYASVLWRINLYNV